MNKPIRVLIIDDDPATSEMLKLVISQLTSDIFIANSGEECLSLTKQHTPDILILDLVMPDMNGAEICKEIRKFSSVPILILSAIDNPKLIAETLNAGADNFLSKPVPSAMLFAHIQKLVKRFRTERPLCSNSSTSSDYISHNY